MNKIKVTLNHYTPLYISANGARTCWASQDKSDTEEARNAYIEESILSGGYAENSCNIIGPKDLALMDRVGNQFHHASILEHISFNFFIDGISRACLQELARHRIASLSVKSSRYTLKELKNEEPFIQWNQEVDTDRTRAAKYIFLTGNDDVDQASVFALGRLLDNLNEGISNDVAKYCMPEAYRTQLTWTINLRSLQNFLYLRTSKKALPEIQHLAKLIYEALPADAKSLVKHCIDPVDELALAKARIAELETQLK